MSDASAISVIRCKVFRSLKKIKREHTALQSADLDSSLGYSHFVVEIDPSSRRRARRWARSEAWMIWVQISDPTNLRPKTRKGESETKSGAECVLRLVLSCRNQSGLCAFRLHWRSKASRFLDTKSNERFSKMKRHHSQIGGKTPKFRSQVGVTRRSDQASKSEILAHSHTTIWQSELY